MTIEDRLVLTYQRYKKEDNEYLKQRHVVNIFNYLDDLAQERCVHEFE